ncbi:MAG: hypothetical protein ACOZNI_22345 [Myxococcota bacterium]
MTGMIAIGRLAALLGVLALLGAWALQIAGGTILGMDQTHLFYDAIALFLFSLICLVDAYWHGRRPA